MKIILVGACGKMGAEIAKAAEQNIVCGIDLFPTALPFPVYDSIKKVKEKADVLIDFSSANGIQDRLFMVQGKRCPRRACGNGLFRRRY